MVPSSQPKAQPKSATAGKKTTAAKGTVAKGTQAKGGNKKGRGRNVRKTQDELDSEMADYFTPNNEAAAAPAAAPAGDAAMQDDINVSVSP